MADQRTPLLSVQHLCKEFPVESGVFGKRFSKRAVHAVNDVSFDIYAGETFGLVGESGCGKSTTGRCIMHLTRPTSGTVLFEGKDVSKMSKKELKEMRRNMQFIFQDPYASLNPRMTIEEIVGEGLKIRGVTDPKEVRSRVVAMLRKVGLTEEHATRYPHEFSGGQRQRIGIARAIITEPKLVIADEPVSALDVSIQAQVINLLNELREEMGLSILFIAHDLSVVKYFSDRIIVMYFGKIVEIADADELFAHPLHPYTCSLLSAIPLPDPHYEKQRKRMVYVPAEAHDYSQEQPTLREVAPGHFVSCNTAEYERYRGKLAQA